MEFGIAETNLVGLIGRAWCDLEPLGTTAFPLGALYDPFVERGLEPWSFGIYAGGQSIIIGTPSGVSLAAEGGAHQSIKTPSIGLEQPGCTSYEPAFAIEVEWTLLACMARLGRPDGPRIPSAVHRPVISRGQCPHRSGGAGTPPPPGRRRRLRAAAPRRRAATIVAMGAMVRRLRRGRSVGAEPESAEVCA